MTGIRNTLALAIVALAISGCAAQSNLMAPAEAPTAAPDAGQARVVFMRPSSLGWAVQASVFETTGDATDFLGIVSAKTQLSVEVDPGRHRFMVVSEAADFMRADLEGGSTYYAIVTPRMGAWKARFSLVPVKRDPDAEFSLGSDRFAQWRESMDPVATTPEARQWARENMENIKDKQSSYWEKWQGKSDADKAKVTLEPSDGSR